MSNYGLALLLIASVVTCAADSRTCTDAEHQVPTDIDAAAIAPCTEVWSSQSTPSSVVSGPLGSYPALRGRYLDRMAYLFRTTGASDLLRLTITYPNDAPRNTEIFTFTEIDQSYGLVPLGTGYQPIPDHEPTH